MTANALDPGVWGVLATPFQGSAFDLCEASLAREVEHFTAAGVTGLVALGVFGEAATLDQAEQAEVAEIVSEETSVPLVFGVPGLATRVVIEQATKVIEAGSRRPVAIMVQVNTPNPVSLGKHLAAVYEATGTPLVVQDYPAVSGVRIAAETLAAVVRDAGDAVAAVKAEEPPVPPAVATLVANTDVPVFGGLGGVSLLDELACGSAGVMTGFSYPEALVATVNAYRDGGTPAARAVFARWLPLVNFEAQRGIALAVRKECLRTRGLFIESAVRPPAPGFPGALHDLLVEHLAHADTLLKD